MGMTSPFRAVVWLCSDRAARMPQTGCTIAPQAVFLPSYHAESPQAFGYFAGQGYQAQYNAYFCPYYVGMVGSMTNDAVEDYTWFFCTTDVESLGTQTTFTLPDYSILTVQINETSARRVQSQLEIDLNANSAGGETHTHYVNVTGPNTALSGRNLALDPNGSLTFLQHVLWAKLRQLLFCPHFRSRRRSCKRDDRPYPRTASLLGSTAPLAGLPRSTIQNKPICSIRRAQRH